MSTAEQTKPFHLKDNFAPVFDEVSDDALQVIGDIPVALNGRFFRNGPNPQTGFSSHWFFGNGMIHGVEFENGKANWYRNRYVKTPLYDDANADAMEALMDLEKSAANTHVVHHAGKILALEEAHLPWEVSKELESVGSYDFGGKLKTPVTAHPKICSVTGEMLFFAYGVFPPYLTYHRVSAEGELVQTEQITVPKGTMMHDFNITEHYVIWMDLPAVWDLDSMGSDGMPLKWDENYGARLGVMPRNGRDADVTWYDIDPCYVFHPANAFEDGNEIIIDVCRKADLDAVAQLYRWVIDLNAGSVTETILDERSVEFPRVCDSKVGVQHRYAYMAELAGAVPYAQRYIKYDFSTMTSTESQLGDGREGSEAVFVKDPHGEQEDSGWLIAYVYDNATEKSEVLILDAATMDDQPVARILLPSRVPMGFHGSWVPN